MIGQATDRRVGRNGCTRVQAWAVPAPGRGGITGHGRSELKIDIIQVMPRAVLRSNHEIVFEDVDAILRT